MNPPGVTYTPCLGQVLEEAGETPCWPEYQRRKSQLVNRAESGYVNLTQRWAELVRMWTLEQFPFGGAKEAHSHFAPGRPAIGSKGRIKAANRTAASVLRAEVGRKRGDSI